MFRIAINEEQRAALLALLSAVDSPAFLGPDAPLEYWVEMLADLPVQEASDPGVLHGFCL